MMALGVGTLLALVALAFVLVPLFTQPRSAPTPAIAPAQEGGAGDGAIEALREVEFDRETGKLSDSDYAALKASYTREALAALRAQDATSPASAPDDEVEAAILRYRARRPACAACGPRPEFDAIYCSTCGAYLPGTCSRCDAPVTEPGARFCASCGEELERKEERGKRKEGRTRVG